MRRKPVAIKEASSRFRGARHRLDPGAGALESGALTARVTTPRHPTPR